MPRFTIKDLLIATTLIAIGAGMLAFIFQGTAITWLDPLGPVGILVFVLIWFGGGASIGAGLFTPFQRRWIGVVTGLVVQFILVLFLIFFRGSPI